MQPLHFRVILFSFILYFLCSGITLRDLLLVHSYHTIQDNALVDVHSRNIFEGAVSGMMLPFDKLHDDYSRFIPYRRQKEFFGELENNYDGIGISYTVSFDKKELPVILYTMLNSPAHKAGIRSGDRIVKVNGKDTFSLSIRELSQLFEKTKSKTVSLTIQKFQSGDIVELTLERQPLFRDTVEGDQIENGERVFTLQTKPEIGYIRITSFSSSTAMELQTALQKIDKPEIKGLILDLRNNPGGYVASSVEAVNLFIKPSSKNDVVVSTRSRDGTVNFSHPVSEDGYKFSKPLVVLIDGESASAAEILAAALQDYKWAKIVGVRSFGKGTVQKIIELPFNSGIIKLTHSSYWRPSGKNINRFWNSKDGDEWGVSPDDGYEVKVSDEQIAAQILLRGVRSNAVGEKKDDYLAEYIKQLSDEVKQLVGQQSVRKQKGPKEELDEENEEPEEKKPDEPFVLQGSAPYYDPQLEKAIELFSSGL